MSAVMVKYNKANVLMFGALVIAPGTNRIPLDVWDSIKSHPLAKEAITSGHLIVVSHDKNDVAEPQIKVIVPKEVLQKKVAPTQDAIDWSTSVSDKIIAAINDSTDIQFIEQFANHKTKKVRTAVANRLAEVSGGN